MTGCCGIAGICGMPIRGIPGMGPAGGAAAGGAARFEGTEIIRVYSLGPCGVATGADPGVTRNACVAPPPGPYEAGGEGACAAGTAGGAPDSAPGPNMRVYSPGSCRGGGGAGAGGAAGNCDAEGNCGPSGIPPGDGLKNSVYSPPLGGGGPASGRAAGGA
jgi:hypothetical protein